MFFYKSAPTEFWLETPLRTSINNCANDAVQALRKISGKNIPENYDGASLLNARALLMNFKQPTQTSANGSCYLLETKDHKWVALNLARESDWQLLPALFKKPGDIVDITQVSALILQDTADELLKQGRNLGLAIAIAEQHNTKPDTWFTIVTQGYNKLPPQTAPRVLDLSSLWAGPLCSHLLQLTGARVIKVESAQRPDGARLNTQPGAHEFYKRINGDKEKVILDFNNPEDIDKLKQLLTQTDIVIEGSRPRAVQQLGINAEDFVKKQAGLVWVSITGYGRSEPESHWIAYGDDAAIGAGLFNIVDEKPVFIGDAIADPLTGIHAALTALTFWQQGKSVLLDINLHSVAKYCARKAQAN